MIFAGRQQDVPLVLVADGESFGIRVAEKDPFLQCGRWQVVLQLPEPEGGFPIDGTAQGTPSQSITPPLSSLPSGNCALPPLLVLICGERRRQK